MTTITQALETAETVEDITAAFGMQAVTTPAPEFDTTVMLLEGIKAGVEALKKVE
jgi:hypothetical protein